MNRQENIPTEEQGRFTGRRIFIVVALAGIAAAALHAMGRSWWCRCGELHVWSGQISGMHNSQHLLDPYTLTHVLHGVLYYALLWLCFRKWIDPAVRGLLAVGIESGWEIMENTNTVIERYRSETLSLGYYGDSIFNSLGDIVACVLGYLFAMWAPVWASVGVFFAAEGLLLWWIRDSLLLNILMLIWPIDAIRTWQLGGK